MEYCIEDYLLYCKDNEIKPSKYDSLILFKRYIEGK